MSANLSSVPPVPPIPTPPAPKTVRDQVISSARDMPELLANAKVFDPQLYAALTGQAAQFSATPLGALAGAAVGWLASYYGLNWDPTFCAMAGGLLLLGGGYAVHKVQAWRAAKVAVANTTGPSWPVPPPASMPGIGGTG